MIWWKDGQAMYMQSMESFKTGTCHSTHTCNQYSLSLDSLLNFVPRFWVCGYKDTCMILWSLLFYILWKENVFNNQNIVLPVVLMSSSLPYSDVDDRVLFFLLSDMWWPHGLDSRVMWILFWREQWRGVWIILSAF